MKIIILLTMCWLCLGMNIAWAEKGSHIHVAVFFVEPTFLGQDFPDEIKQHDIAGALDGKAELMTFVHSVAIESGDVLNIQNDTLRVNDGGGLIDYGINCELSVNIEPSWTLAGICKIFLSGKENTTRHIISPVPVPEYIVWYKVFEDKKNNLVTYTMKELGEDMR